MLDKQYKFRNAKKRRESKYQLKYKRKESSGWIVRRFNKSDMMLERLDKLKSLGFYGLQLHQRAKTGRMSRVLQMRNGDVMFQSELDHHRQPHRRYIINPERLDPSRAQLRKDLKAKYDIEYLSKNKGLSHE